MSDVKPDCYAFPFSLPQRDGTTNCCPGMTLRDYFAAAAVSEAMRAFPDADAVARLAYEVADAMLKRRASTP